MCCFIFMSFQIDHFGFANGGTFQQRYLVADQFWNHNGGPIFFYTGNEGDIDWFTNNTVRRSPSLSIFIIENIALILMK